MTEPPVASLAERLGLHRPELRAWAMYDWANSAFVTTIVAVVFPIYYAKVAAQGLPEATATTRFGLTTTVALAVSAVVSPFLGALADAGGLRKRLLFLCQLLGLLCCGGMWFVRAGDWGLALVLFGLGNIGVSSAFIFYDSLLPHVARPDELDRVSTAGYALGYLGGGLLLGLNLLCIQKPQWFGLADSGVASRLSFVSVAVWWGLFSIPLFRRVSEPARGHRAVGQTPPANLVGSSLRQLRQTLSDLARFRPALLMLIAFLLYNDGIGTIWRMASIYGTEVGIGSADLGLALLLVQFVGIPFAFLFGRLAGWLGAKRSIFLALGVYGAVSVLSYVMTRAVHFYLLAFLVAMVQGGSQALSRSLFAAMIPRHKSSEFFAFFAVFEKFAGIFGPLFFTCAVGLTGSSRTAILSVVLFFVAGGALLTRVDVAAGERLARAAEREAQPGAEGP
jgi:UMF1 family MFS transporter